LKNVMIIAAGTLALSVATRAALAAPPEYNRGYNDCLAGRYGGGAVQPLLQAGMLGTGPVKHGGALTGVWQRWARMTPASA
jgi:hypothetical protein